MENKEFSEQDLKIAFSLTLEERKKCIEEIIEKNKKILHVFEQSILPQTKFDYKNYINSVLLFVSSANILLNGELTDVKINIYSLTNNNLTKKEVKKIVLENVHCLELLKTRS